MVQNVHPGASVITAHIKTVNLALPDVTLRLDMDGVIREVSLANSVSSEGADAWVGRPWVETVGDVGSDRVLRMVADARDHGVSDFRQVTQCFPSGLELPMEYNTVRLGAGAGLIAIGKNLQAVAGVQAGLLATQQVREQDAWKLRAVETRYRTLFQSSDDPMLMLHIDDLRVIDANPAAIRAGAMDAGRDFPAVVTPRDREAFRGVMDQVREHGRAPGILLHLGASSVPWLVRASLATGEAEPVFLLHLAPAAPALPPRREAASVEDLLQRLPDGFTLVDPEGLIRHANRAFLDLVQVAAPAAVIGQPIGRWLSRPGADAGVLMANVRRHGTVRSFTTTLQGDLGSEAEVEISAAGDLESGPRFIGLLLRDVSRRLPGTPVPPAVDGLLGPLVKLTEQIGRVPLLQLVRETSDLIERHCIERALVQAKGNRTATAELLGLSRQSLYAKLNRYSIGIWGDKAEAD